MKKLVLLIIILFSVTLFPEQAFSDLMTIGDEHLHIYTRGKDKDVPFVVTDPQGRRLGFDPRLNKGIAEFQGAYDPSFDLRNEVSDEYQTESYINLMQGEYTIELINQVNEEFSFFGVIVSFEKRVDFEFRGWASAGHASVFKFVYNGPNAADIGKIVRFATPASLKEDIIMNSVPLGDGLMKSLLSKVEAIEASIARGNKTAAANQIDAFINEVQALSDVYFEEIRDGKIIILRDPIHKKISRNNSKLFIEGAQYIKDHLRL